jgi:hypothetical protein
MKALLPVIERGPCPTLLSTHFYYQTEPLKLLQSIVISDIPVSYFLVDKNHNHIITLEETTTRTTTTKQQQQQQQSNINNRKKQREQMK